MRFRTSENERLKRAFQEVYAAKARDELGDGWPSQVMRRVRQAGPLKSTTVFWSSFENLVWRLVPVSCVLVFLFGVLFMKMEIGSGYDYLGTVRAEMERPSLSELYGLEG